MMTGKMRHGNGNTLHNSLFLIKYRELCPKLSGLVEDLKESSQVCGLHGWADEGRLVSKAR
jgi:hypothetical protein